MAFNIQNLFKIKFSSPIITSALTSIQDVVSISLGQIYSSALLYCH